MRAPMKMVARVVVVGLLVLGAGCKGSCRKLSEKLCECTVNTVDKDSCMSRASSNDANTSPTASDQELCRSLLADCDCRLIDTPEGKIRCGLARPAK